MWHGAGWGALALPAFLLLAGCADTAANAAPKGPGSTFVVPGGHVEGTGTIRGFVVDEEQVGVGGALVGLLELKVQVVADAQGVFAFANVPPGKYTVAASHVGYDSDLAQVTVEPDKAVQVLLTLSAIPIVVPYHEINGPFNGFYECRYGVTYVAGAWASDCGTVCVLACVGPGTAGVNPWPNNKNVFRFNMSGDEWRTFVGEMRWQQGTFATSQQLALVFSHKDRVASHWFCRSESGSPLGWRLEKDVDKGTTACVGGTKGGAGTPPEPAKNLTLQVHGSIPFGTLLSPVNLAFQQRYEAYVTAFYGTPAPANYSSFPDG